MGKGKVHKKNPYRQTTLRFLSRPSVKVAKEMQKCATPQLGFPQNQPNKCCLIVSIAAQLSPSLLNCFPRAIHLHMKYIVARTKA